MAIEDHGSGSRMIPLVREVTVVDPAGKVWSRDLRGQLFQEEEEVGRFLKPQYELDGGQLAATRERSVVLSGDLSKTSAPYCSGPAD